jgi:sirohydrochlorin cobaltochelatase
VDDFTDAALVLVGHGTTLNEDSATPVLQHAAELRHRKLFAEVHEAFWKQEPQVVQVLGELTAPRVFIVPFFISAGYFSEEVIPEALEFRQPGKTEFNRVRMRGTQKLVYCGPVGTHDRMTGVLLSRARQVLERFPFPRVPRWKDSSLFIAGHGTERNENSRIPVERQAELIRSQNLYADVHAVFMEEEPRIKNCIEMATTRNLIVIPFFISDGLHVREDIPVLLGEPERLVKQRVQVGQPTWRNPTERHGKLVWYAPSVGTDARMTDVILERVREAATWQ